MYNTAQSTMGKSAKHYKTAIENTKDEQQKEKAKEYALIDDSLCNQGIYHYTCPLFNGYEHEKKMEKARANDSIEYWNYCVGAALFDSIRKRNDFKSLLI